MEKSNHYIFVKWKCIYMTNLETECLCLGVLKRLEEEDLDEGVRKRLKDSSETPGALWHIYLNRDMDKVRDFLHKVSNLKKKKEKKKLNSSEWKTSAQIMTSLTLSSSPSQPPPSQLCKEQGLDLSLDQDPFREQGLYLSRKQRQRLLDEHGVQGWTIVQFLGDSVLIPAGAMHQVYRIFTHAHTLYVHPLSLPRKYSL